MDIISDLSFLPRNEGSPHPQEAGSASSPVASVASTGNGTSHTSTPLHLPISASSVGKSEPRANGVSAKPGAGLTWAGWWWPAFLPPRAAP